MLTVTRRHDIGDGTVPVGTAENAAELLELLTDARPGAYVVTGSRSVQLDLQAPIGGDLGFVEQIVQIVRP